LAGQHAALRHKGLTVLGVQAAVTDARSFQEWKDSDAMPFPLGRVAEKSGATRWATGIESLPWLVLTDVQDRVVAEGFVIEEIDAKITALEK
jgi:hypothetical protein